MAALHTVNSRHLKINTFAHFVTRICWCNRRIVRTSRLGQLPWGNKSFRAFHSAQSFKMAQMKEVIVQPDLTTKIQNSPIPKPGKGQILIAVKVSGTNPKDWKRPKYMNKAHNSGDDIAGIVEEVGEGVFEFRKGDRVAAFHEMMAPHGSFAEYAIAWDHATFHLPSTISFESAATIPLAANTAAVGLYWSLGLPPPWQPTLKKMPLIIYGGAGAVGSFAIKFAKASNIHPLIVVAGNSQAHVEQLIDRSKGDTIVDYRKGEESVIADIAAAVKACGAEEVNYAFDTISEKGSYQTLSKALGSSKSYITCLLPTDKSYDFPPHITKTQTMCGISFKALQPDDFVSKQAGVGTGGQDFALVFFRLMARGLREGWFTPHPFEVIPGGLEGVGEGLERLEVGQARAVKFVYRVAED